MSLIDVDFGSGPPFLRRRSGVIFVVVSLLLGLSSLGYATLSKTVERLVRVRDPARDIATESSPSADDPNLPDSIAAARVVIDRLQIPWLSLFTTLEQSANPQVVVLRVDPDPAKKEVRITVNAADWSKGLAYASALQAVGTLDHVYVASQRAAAADPLHPVQMVILSRWSLGDVDARPTTQPASTQRW